MRILILHHANDAIAGPWNTRGKWDLCLDLGAAGQSSYAAWSERLGCPVEPAGRLATGDFERIRECLGYGGRGLVDQHGLDWWDLISFEFHQQIEEIARLQSVAAKLDSRDGIYITRSGFQSRVLSLLTGHETFCFSNRAGFQKSVRHYAQVISRFSLDELLQITADKYDSGYRLRRLFNKRPKKLSRPVVLLPSAYVNVSRTELQYAEMLPDVDFLLIATRDSALNAAAAENVKVAKLASYARRDDNQGEFASLLGRWNQLRPEMMRQELLSVLIRSGVLDSFPVFLQNGLRIRDAWLRVFRQQPVCAVFCADDANLPTRIPLAIAVTRGLPAISCHHGALDGRYRIRPPRDWPVLAKGQMERDYLVRECQVGAENVRLGAPRRSPPHRTGSSREPSLVVFFSEPYELVGARCSEFYREVLPPLAEVTASAGRKLVLKLHPMESLRERESVAVSVLSDSVRGVLQVVSGPLRDELLNQTWFAVTVASTIAVDCTLSGIPVFLCEWLDYSRYGYLQQFVKFGAGTALKSASCIHDIPQMLERFQRKSAADLWQTITPERLRELLGQRVSMAAAG